ncbi:MAG: ABC transporter permease [Acidimicrobiia bacterium]|nr:ABC transporter permease [Acidimicrobiia bacterium]
MKRLRTLAAKESRQFLRDRLTLSIAAALPIVLMALYGTALNFDVRNLQLAVIDQDNSSLSRAYLEAFSSTNKFVLLPPPDGTLDEMFDAGKARAALIIPPGFERGFKRGVRVEAQLVIDGTESNTALLVRNIGEAVSRTFRPAGQPPLALRVRHWYNPGLSDSLFFGSGAMGLVLILFPSLRGAGLAELWPQLGALAVFAVALYAVSAWRFRGQLK